jgi:hypothetical protein
VSDDLGDFDNSAIKRLVVDGVYETDTLEFMPNLKLTFTDQNKRD